MLDYAINHIVPLQIECLWAQDNPNNSFFFLRGGSGINLINDKNRAHEFVSLDENGKVLGFIRYSIFNNSAINLELISFYEDSLVFSRDLMEALNNIFYLYEFDRIQFSAHPKHPLLSKYKNIINKFNGRYKEDKKDGYILFELKEEDYKNTKTKK